MSDAQESTDPGLRLLVSSTEPAIRHATMQALLDVPSGDPTLVAERAAIARGPVVAGLLAGQRNDGSFGVHPYQKFTGAHWRLVTLTDLGVPTSVPGLFDAHDTVLDWLIDQARRVPTIAGRARRCASQEGNALVVAIHLGRRDDARVQAIVASLVRWQWPDGGWNCDRRPAARHSSVVETLATVLGLHRYAQAMGDDNAGAAADRGAAFLLRHRLLFSERTGALIHPSFIRLRYPPYWHYDALAALKVLVETGHGGDERLADALDILESKRRPDGTWHAEGRHARRPGVTGPNRDVVEWIGRGPSEPLTLGALRVLRAAGRWSRPDAVRTI